MTQEEYNTQRSTWIAQLLSYKKPRFTPRCIRYRLKQIAKLDADYSGRSEQECYQLLLAQFKDIYTEPNTSSKSSN